MARKTGRIPHSAITEKPNYQNNAAEGTPPEDRGRSPIGEMQMLRYSLEQCLFSQKQDVLSNLVTQKTAEVLSYELLVMASLIMSMSVLLKTSMPTSKDFVVTLDDQEAALRVLAGQMLWLDSVSFHFE